MTTAGQRLMAEVKGRHEHLVSSADRDFAAGLISFVDFLYSSPELVSILDAEVLALRERETCRDAARAHLGKAFAGTLSRVAFTVVAVEQATRSAGADPLGADLIAQAKDCEADGPGGSLSIRELLQSARDEPDKLSREDPSRYRAWHEKVCPTLLDKLKPLESVSRPSGNFFSEKRNQFRVEFELQRQILIDFDAAGSVFEALAPSEALDALHEFHITARSLLAGEVGFPLPPSLSGLEGGRLRARFRHALDLATDRILSVLARRADRDFVLHRMQAFFQSVGKGRLLSELSRRKSNRAEATIQQEVDAFLFSEGFFPITHASAAGGSIDTFVENQLAGAMAELRELPIEPFLLELKQATKHRVTPKRLVTLIRDARAQAQRYAEHLRAHREWRAHRVFICIFYGGKVRYSVSAPDVMLVYLGSAGPSKGSQFIEV